MAPESGNRSVSAGRLVSNRTASVPVNAGVPVNRVVALSAIAASCFSAAGAAAYADDLIAASVRSSASAAALSCTAPAMEGGAGEKASATRWKMLRDRLTFATPRMGEGE